MDGKILDYDNLHYLTDSIILDIKKKEILEANPTYTTKIDNVVQTGNRFFESVDIFLAPRPSDLNTSEYEYFSTVEYNNELHLFVSTYHYKYSKNVWVKLNNLPVSCSYGKAITYNNQLYHFFSNKTIYVWNNTTDTWELVGEIPYQNSNSGIVVFNNEVHLIGSETSSTSRRCHYSWDGSDWTELDELPFDYYEDKNCVVYNNKIHLITPPLSNQTQNATHYSWDGTNWEIASTLPVDVNISIELFVYNDALYLYGRYWKVITSGNITTKTGYDPPDNYEVDYLGFTFKDNTWIKYNLLGDRVYLYYIPYNNKLYRTDIKNNASSTPTAILQVLDNDHFTDTIKYYKSQ